MEKGFELPVKYNGQELLFAARLVQYGYTYKIEVDVKEVTLSFERDEERAWRVLIDPEKMKAIIPVDLINAITQSLDAL